MNLSSVMSTALSGMRSEQTRLANSAANIAGPGSVSETDAEINLANELLTIRQAEIGFAANAIVFETGAELWDVLMTIKRD